MQPIARSALGADVHERQPHDVCVETLDERRHVRRQPRAPRLGVEVAELHEQRRRAMRRAARIRAAHRQVDQRLGRRVGDAAAAAAASTATTACAMKMDACSCSCSTPFMATRRRSGT